MGLGKQAKTLTKGQTEAVLGYLAKTRWPTRNRVIFLLSVKAGLRAKEIAKLTWRMVTDARGQIGDAISLENAASKGQSGRVVPISEELRAALVAYAPTVGIVSGRFMIESERSRSMSAQAIVNLFWRWYRYVGFNGCSSHSGRRTFITSAARKISTVGGSLRDVQMLAGHSNLRTTQRYIEPNPEAQVRIVELV
ncbi:site-specific integrase [Bradyrhizobium sp. KBS0727]|uniref:tyrosine-type recombinase/integrase n=1 Tax=unclassified Bradyrhizobium TaxID=2631580 RepID=UPI00110EDF10|nr:MULTISPECIES: site-specific integrase [unclassified Bradyrhizobium]QDW35832.1 site-specific integrase [Bradyrhizobium sp. KBS0725]QDW42432.1 site-specific integrase [Bradyrhizobium sp. KBS0727]